MPTDTAAVRIVTAPDRAPPDRVGDLHAAPTGGRDPALQALATLEPLAGGREQGAQPFSVSRATWDRWDASGLLGPVGTKKAGRKPWILSELREWAAAGMPCRKEWLARNASMNANGRPR